jgi:putative oxidoreductase
MGFGKGSVGSEDSLRDLGLFVLRAGVGASVLIFHGYAKITSGPVLWTKLGASVGQFGIHFFPVFWGFMAAASESVGSALLILGLFFRPASALLACTMLVAASKHLGMAPGAPNAGWNGATHALELLAVYVGLFLTGPGRYSLAPRWTRK